MIAIIAVLATVVILALNPAQLLMQARDANRVSDLANINQALTLYAGDVGTGMGSSSVVYVSVPDPTATTAAGSDCAGIGLSSSSLPSGWTWHCAGPDFYRKVNGEGWIPVDFTQMSSGSPFGSLPTDPVNQTSSGLYYTYTVNGDPWELTANMESQKYQMGGSHDVVSKDGGQYPDLYEVGTDLSMDPVDYDPSLVGYWKLDEGSGTTAYDSSMYENNGTLEGSTDLPTWTTSGCITGDCLSFDGGDDYIDLGQTSASLFVPEITMSAWINPSAAPAGWQLIYGYHEWPKLYVDVTGSGDYLYFYDNNTGYASVHTIPIGGWTFVTASSDGAQAWLYINGSLDKTYSVTRWSTSPSLTLIGRDPNLVSGQFFDGLIQDVTVYSRALSAAEIQAIYNSEK